MDTNGESLLSLQMEIPAVSTNNNTLSLFLEDCELSAVVSTPTL
jgi:hypothetical protein